MSYVPSGRRAPAQLLAVVVALTFISACSTNKSYEDTFSQKTALTNNSHTYDNTPDQTFRATKVTLVQQGFSIEQADVGVGLLKGLRTYDDPKNTQIAYLVTASVDITGTPSGRGTVVTVSASQQTVLHRDVHKYYHLLGLVPIPTGKDYQTVVRAEGDITGKGFYQDFFTAVARNLQDVPTATTTAVVLDTATSSPVAPVAVAAPPVPAAAPAVVPAAPAAAEPAVAPAPAAPSGQ